MVMESWILWVSCKENGFTSTLQETQSICDSKNIKTIQFIAYIYILL